jgi:transposase
LEGVAPASEFGPDQEPATIPSGLHVLPRRWVIEHTLAWLDHYRWLRKDHKRLPATGESFASVAMSRLVLRRLARQNAAKVS